MKKIGILGGMSAVSTQIYYKNICSLVTKKLGDLNSPELIIRSLNFEPLAKHMHSNQWDSIAEILNFEAKKLEQSGADFIILATNTMHKLADKMMSNISIPLLHIADATADELIKNNRNSPAFIATKFTMDENFYTDRLKIKNLNPMVPKKEDREEINRIIFDELCVNKINSDSQKKYIDCINEMISQGADSLILGCTEVCLLLNKDNVSVPVFDTTEIHCNAAVEFSLKV